MRVRQAAALLWCLILVVALMAGCAADSSPTEPPHTEAPTAAPTEAVEEPTAAEEQPAAAPEGVEVSTSFGSLYYQEQWEEFMRTEQTQTDNSVAVSFQSEINGVVYDLFTVTIGEGEGAAVGVLTDGNGQTRSVYVSMEEIALSSDLTEEECNRLYAMQEEVNFVIDNLK